MITAIIDGHKLASVGLRELKRCLAFTLNHGPELPLKERVAVGARFFLYGSIPEFDDDPDNLYPLHEEAQVLRPFLDEGRFLELFYPIPDKKPSELALPVHQNESYLRCPWSGICLEMSEAAINSNELTFDLVPIFSVVVTTARVMAACIAETPLLLIGPPGIGKSKIVEAVATRMGVKSSDPQENSWFRVNLSTNSTLEQLIGTTEPVCEDNKRMFRWRNGVILDALERNAWLLLDEINLAPPEVLDGIAALLNPDVESFTVPTTGKVIPLVQDGKRRLRVFGAMNPASIGGGRNRLPQSIESLFTTVKLAH